MPVPDDRALAVTEVKAIRESLWVDYKAAALALGWDRAIAPAPSFPSVTSPADFALLRNELPPLAPALMPCGDEKMPYFLFSRGTKPENGFPLFFHTHGGGSTDAELDHPHA